MLGNTLKVEKTNCNFSLQANLLWILKSLLFFDILLIFSFATAIFIFNKPNSLKCDRPTRNCILNIATIFNSYDVEIPLEKIQDAEIENHSTGNTIKLVTSLSYPVQLSGAMFSRLDNPTETLTTIKNFLDD